MAITEEQRGTLNPAQAAAATEIINRYSTSVNAGTAAEQEVRRSVTVGPEQKLSPLPPETSGLGATGGAMLGSIAMETRGASVGRLIGGVLGTVLTRSPQGAKTGMDLGGFAGAAIASAAGAGTAGAAGDLAERMASGLYKDGQNLNDAFLAAANAGEKEAAYDFIGGLISKGGAGALRKLVGGPMQPGAQEAQTILNRYGTGLALDQAVDRAILDEVSGALRGGFLSGGPFDKLNEAQDKAVVEFYDDFIGAYAGAARDKLTPEGAGKLLLTTLRDGEKVFDTAVADMFSMLDSQVVLRSSAPTQVEVEVAPAISGVMDRVTKQVEAQAFQRPVDVSAVRGRAKGLVDDLKDIGDIDPTAEGTNLLRNIASGSSRLTFAQTHTLISDLKRLQRSGRLSGLPAETKVGDFITLLQGSFDEAGSKLPGNLPQNYSKIRAFTRFGKQRFESEFVAKLMENEAIDSAALADVVVNAAPGDIVRLRQTLRLSDRFRGQPAGASWRIVQGAMLDRVLPQNVEQIGNSPIFRIKTDRALQRQMAKMFSDKELATINRNVDLLNKIVLARPGTGALSGRQAGAALRGLYGLGGAALGAGTYSESGASSAAAAVTTYLIAPKLLSKAIASPKLTAALASWDNALRITGPSKGGAILKATRMMEQAATEFSAEE